METTTLHLKDNASVSAISQPSLTPQAPPHIRVSGLGFRAIVAWVSGQNSRLSACLPSFWREP